MKLTENLLVPQDAELVNDGLWNLVYISPCKHDWYIGGRPRNDAFCRVCAALNEPVTFEPILVRWVTDPKPWYSRKPRGHYERQLTSDELGAPA